MMAILNFFMTQSEEIPGDSRKNLLNFPGETGPSSCKPLPTLHAHTKSNVKQQINIRNLNHLKQCSLLKIKGLEETLRPFSFYV